MPAAGQSWSVAPNWHLFALQVAEKASCHSERSEESLCELDLHRREILRSAQNGKEIEFVRTHFRLRSTEGVFHTGPRSRYPSCYLRVYYLGSPEDYFKRDTT